MWRYIIGFTLIVFLAGCQESRKVVKEDKSGKFLIEARDDWKVEFGDTEHTRLMFNIAANRFDIKELIKAYMLLQKEVFNEPGEPSLRESITALECRFDPNEFDPNEPNEIIITIPEGGGTYTFALQNMEKSIFLIGKKDFDNLVQRIEELEKCACFIQDEGLWGEGLWEEGFWEEFDSGMVMENRTKE